MVVIATQQDLDWLFESLALAGNCGSCPSRVVCDQADEAEEAAGIPVEERVSCGEMLRSKIGAVITKKENLCIPGQQRRT